VAKVSVDAADTLLSLLGSTEGVPAALAEIQLREGQTGPSPSTLQILAGQARGDVAEETKGFQYPAAFVYCDRVVNSQREKFRKFSGEARLNVEVRVSGSHLDGLERSLERCVDAVTEVLGRSHGDWGRGVHYSGAYEVEFEPVKHGGRNYIQTARVVLEVSVSQD